MQYNRVQHDPLHGQFGTTRSTGVTKHKDMLQNSYVQRKLLADQKVTLHRLTSR
jgi:hypothetical protein